MMGNHGQIKSVILPLQAKRAAPKGWARMVEEGKSFARTREFNTIGTWYSAVGVTLGLILALLGWLTTGNNNSKDIQVLKDNQIAIQAERQADRKEYQEQLKAIITQDQDQFRALSAQIGEMTKQMPSTYQMQTIQESLASLRGTVSALTDRVTADERLQIQDHTQLGNIQASSGANLQGHPR